MGKNTRKISVILYIVATIFYIISLYFFIKNDFNHTTLMLCYGSIILGISGLLSNLANRQFKKTK